MADVKFVASIDTRGLDVGLARANQKVSNFTQTAVKNANSIENTFIKVGKRLIAYGGIFAALNLVKEIVRVRGEFQQLQIAFETMLDSKEKADKLMAQAIDLAQKTPFTLTEVAQNTKQLLAMGVGAENVIDTLKDLGNVAAGLSVPMQRIAINYGQVLALGRLQAREVRDFAMAGVPLIGELSKNLGKTTEEIQNMVSKGQVGFKDVEEAFKSMANEGGKFNNLMEKQVDSVTGKINILVGELQLALNEIGKQNEGLIYGTIDGLSYLVEHYNTITKAIGNIVVAYGSYRAAIILTNAVQKSVQFTYFVQETLALQNLLSKSQLANVAKQKLIAGSAAHNLAIKKELQIESELLAARVASHSIQLQNLRTIWVAKGKSLVLANAELVAAKSKLASITAETSATQVAIIQQRVANAQTKVNTLTTEKNALAKSIKGKITQRNTAATALDSHVTRLDTTVKIANTNATNFLKLVKTLSPNTAANIL